MLETSKNVVRYYPKHGKLVFHLPDYYSPRTCSMHIGKGVGLDLTALDDNPDVLHRLIEILQQIEKSALYELNKPYGGRIPSGIFISV